MVKKWSYDFKFVDINSKKSQMPFYGFQKKEVAKTEAVLKKFIAGKL